MTVNDEEFTSWIDRVNARLHCLLPPPDQNPQPLHRAMRYAVLNGGKRFRPLLVYAAGQLFDVAATHVDHAACAVELIHAYSLIHDDLPSMDNDALRRGRPTVHIAFGEAMAILAGDALQTLAFASLIDIAIDAQVTARWLRILADAAGSLGMCGGQAIDIESNDQSQTLEELEHMHGMKTGALIHAALHMGAAPAHPSKEDLQQLTRFAKLLGLAFQLRDDVLDVEGTSQQLGKTVGKDQAQAKSTYPALLGLAGAKARLHELDNAIEECLTPFSTKAAALRRLSAMTIHRTH